MAKKTTAPANPIYVKEIQESLSESPPRLPSRFFYDERGSQLFDAICELPEYYVTRTETGILEKHVSEMAKHIGPSCELVEYGSGSSTKTHLLLDALETPAVYVPVEISRQHLRDSAERISERYPTLRVEPLCANFTEPLEIPPLLEPEGKRVGFFPGSTLGNLSDEGARELFANMAHTIGAGGLLLIGVDLVKPTDVLIPAYDDAAGVTAQFNLNMLTHLKRILGLQVNENQFTHRAIWNSEQSRIEMWLEALSDQTIQLEECSFSFARGERILTEFSHKYTPERLFEIAEGFTPVAQWSDPNNWFLIQLLAVQPA